MPIPVRMTALLASVACALTACASTAEKEPPKVASFKSEAAAPSPSAANGPPVIRVDMTNAEEEALFSVYLKCLHDNGVPMTQQADGTWMWAGAESKIQSDTPKIKKACDNMLPQQAPEKAAATNPYYEEDNDKFWQCLKDHGDDVNKGADGWSPGPKWGEFPNAEAVTEQCEVRSFNGKKG
ncbi:hypothetical protein [Actinoplanes sp. NBRC 103695]|uniref:hypothetical protein n=1 Tax=Actinoplanes sp. NBRC 103695 TaxID=3032202 RepID=UPI0024A24ACA|nr:hypothetical protein [Actinoplanes sp. NBRC 103695]GLY99781.1 hypothetical protein Acsp02_70340 [Actinoplanes sp. NBRC 103695]